MPLKVAFIRRNGLGDLLCAYPMIAQFKKNHPDAEITLFVDETNAPLAPYLSHIDHIAIFGKGNRYFQAIKTALKWRHKKFDISILARPSPMKLIHFFQFFLGGKSFPIERKKLTGEHQALRLLQIMDPAAQEVPEELWPKIRLEKEKGEGILISMTNHRPTSQISAERYARLLSHFPEKKVIISCLPKDLDQAQKVQQLLQNPSEIISTTHFEEFLQTINRAAFVFSGDGGLMHLAAALDKPQLVLFGMAPIESWKPLSNKVVCLRHEKEDVQFIDEVHILQALKNVSSVFK